MNAPRIMVAAVLLGSVTSFIFIVSVLFSINDFDGLITSEFSCGFPLTVRSILRRSS